MSTDDILDDILQDLSSDQTTKLAEVWTRLDYLAHADLADFSASTLSRAAGEKSSLPSGENEIPIDTAFLRNKHIVKALERLTPGGLSKTLRDNTKHEDPDLLLVRFLRARNWNVDVAFAMLLNSLAWRIEDQVETKLVAVGDGPPTTFERSKEEEKIAAEVIHQFSCGESFVHGRDKAGRPITWVRVKYHDPSAQSKEGFVQAAVLDTESTRMLLRPPITCGSVVFDLTGFGLRNMVSSPKRHMPRTISTVG